MKFILAVFFLFSGVFSFADSKPAPTPTPSPSPSPSSAPTAAAAATSTGKSLEAKVSTDGAAVYARPDFDSEVIDYLNINTIIPASHRLFAGKAGMGLFHKVKTPAGKLGYIADTDVTIPRGSKIEVPPGAIGRKKKQEEKAREKQQVEEDYKPKQPIYLTRYIGGSLAMVDYTEKFDGRHIGSETPFLGLRLSGPKILFDGPPFDLNIQFYPLPPRYLDQFGTGSAHGFLLLGDFDLLLPFSESKNWLIYYGLGPMWTYSNYSVKVGNQSYNSQDLRFGFDFDVGAGYRFSRYIMKLDIKYYLEVSMYFAGMYTFQVEY